MKNDQTIFLTGATGNMGREALVHLLARGGAKIRILVLPTEGKHPVIEQFSGHRDVEILWGDLTRYEDVERGVAGSDIVLHVGGMVSPLADRFPDLTRRVNVGGAQNIVRAIQSQPEPDRIRLVYIGTVAQTGSRMAPVHWGRTGDPIKISHFDHYAVTKTEAEAIVAQSGLKYWVSLRQTGMAYPTIWKIHDPIMFHNPFNGVFEWVTAKDSGRLMANICGADVPEMLWRGFYNIGGGESCRVVNHEYMVQLFKALGISDFRRIFDPNWFATRNFHGQWYVDSDRLQAVVPYRSQSVTDFLAELSAAVPWLVKAVGRFAPGLVNGRIKALAKAEGGPLYWLAHDDRAHIDAYFGSRDAWAAIPSTWADYQFEQPSRTPTLLDHGYDESLDPADWTVTTLREAASFRGGKFLGDKADAHTNAPWQCALGHGFSMTPNLMLKGGHWCPHCQTNPDSYSRVASRSPFFAQVAPF